MSYADQLYLMQLDFEKRAQVRRAAVDRQFQALRDEERRRQEEREAREAQADSPAQQYPAWTEWEPKELQIIYNDDEDGEEAWANST